MTTVLIAPDKFKGSLSAAEVADTLAGGLTRAGMDVLTLPLADGGDGSVAAALAAGSTAHLVTVAGATGNPHNATIAIDGDTAVVEVANTCGLAAAPGAGAAGGCGYAAALLGARIVSGADFFLDLLDFETHCAQADFVIHRGGAPRHPDIERQAPRARRHACGGQTRDRRGGHRPARVPRLAIRRRLRGVGPLSRRHCS